jgi:outer membrane immunogenic protein
MKATLKATLLAGAAFSLLTVSAFAADLGVPLVKAPVVAPFTWTGCYAGGHVGGGWASKDVTDPEQLVQDSFLGDGTTYGAGLPVTTVNVSPSGFVGGGQIGCDYQFAARWVAGIEGAISGSTMKASTALGVLPLGFPGDTTVVSAKADFIPSITARLGYAVDRVLLYARGGVAWAGDQYDVTGAFQGAPFAFEGLETRTGWTAGGGVEWAAWGPFSVSLEYDYYDFGHATVLMIDSINGFQGPLSTKQSIQVVKLGVNFHVFAGQDP